MTKLREWIELGACAILGAIAAWIVVVMILSF